ncbi:MAG: transglutaminase family protein [Hyphomicrobiales bacterium]
MLISVRHETRYRFEEDTRYSIQRLRLTPPSFEGQSVKRWGIEARGMKDALAYRDAFGNLTHVLTRNDLHRDVTIVAAGEVETQDRAGVILNRAGSVPDVLFLRETNATRADDAIRGLAAAVQALKGLDLLHALANSVRDRIDYVIGATHAHTTAAEAVSEGRGVCQDHAHVFIAAARALHIPARYVSGYLVVADGEPAEASHGWAEALVPDLGWVGFDVANRICPTDRYVRLAIGLDAHGAAPVTGIRRGGSSEEMTVSVDVGPAQ